jgi:hypothetical protein
VDVDGAEAGDTEEEKEGDGEVEAAAEEGKAEEAEEEVEDEEEDDAAAVEAATDRSHRPATAPSHARSVRASPTQRTDARPAGIAVRASGLSDGSLGARAAPAARTCVRACVCMRVCVVCVRCVCSVRRARAACVRGKPADRIPMSRASEGRKSDGFGGVGSGKPMSPGGPHWES